MAGRAPAIADRREPLSRERVLRAALELADRDGIAALSMRNLAHQLGIEAMSLYHYVERKEDLLAGLGDMVMQEIELPSAAPGEWKSAVRRMAVSYHAALGRHSWYHGLAPTGTSVGPATLAYMEWVLGTLRRGGFSARLTHHAYHILDSHIVGSSKWEAGIKASLSKQDLPDLAKRVLERVPADRFPYFHEHAQQHIGGATKGDKRPFELGLDLILDGLDRLRDERPKRRRG
ncbi:MAG TPA: TetR/AcrR family transcriptional regulator C-terminal domain-containing protein [Candidatus Limnocylindria bacterium]|nr:TetR/AcrR family transcriptional regulator C-terminal domain-containing protein [Candidatus Limnocylindria bacterium]